jgi:TonB family protein
MKVFPVSSSARRLTAHSVRMTAVLGGVALAIALGQTFAQTPAAPQAPADAGQQPAASTPALPDASPQPAASAPVQSAAGAATTPSGQSAAGAPEDTQAGAITEDEVKQLLVGKMLYLRDGYLDNSLSFDEHGKLVGHSPQGSYTLSLVQLDKVHLSKHKVELTGVRYGLHFLGARADEDPTKAVDKVRITPKKKVLKITIDRELVVTPKKKKVKKGEEAATAKAGSGTPATPTTAASPATPATTATATTPATTTTAAGEPSDADQAKAEMDTAPEAERPADSASVTTTTSPAHAAHMLRDAIDHIFAPGLDERMIAAMPSFWKLYYQAVANQAEYKPTDPSIYRQSGVDQKAKLLSTIEPPSNEYAQTNGVAGMALYHAVIGADGKPQEIVVSRPIGFGLDESAADTIRKASFQPAMKDGKAVPVMLDVVVQFRIYSKRTDQPGKPEVEAATAGPKLPGPYSVNHQ